MADQWLCLPALVTQRANYWMQLKGYNLPEYFPHLLAKVSVNKPSDVNSI
jgi:hypothetical protein